MKKPPEIDQALLDELVRAEPGMTFFEAQAALLRRGIVAYEDTRRPDVHAELFMRYRRAKERAHRGRYLFEVEVSPRREG